MEGGEGALVLVRFLYLNNSLEKHSEHPCPMHTKEVLFVKQVLLICLLWKDPGKRYP